MITERRRATLYLVLIFLCGTLSGAVAVNLWQRMTVSAQSVPAALATTARKRPLEWFQEKLQLSSDQTTKLTQILDETHYAYKHHEQEIDSIRNQGNARIREILTPDQQTKFDAMVSRSEQKRVARREQR